MRPILLAVVLTASLMGIFFSGWTDAGCGFDPSGCPGGAVLDAGCGMDPSGCPNAAVRDEGCGFDPSGCPKGS